MIPELMARSRRPHRFSPTITGAWRRVSALSKKRPRPAPTWWRRAHCRFNAALWLTLAGPRNPGLYASQPDNYSAKPETCSANLEPSTAWRSEEHTSELQSHSFISYAV